MKVYVTALLFSFAFLSPSLFANGNQDDTKVPLPKQEVSEANTVIDSIGREVVLNGPVERIAFSHPSTGEALKIIGAWDMVKGRSATLTDSIMYPNLEEVPSILASQNVYDLNYEAVFEMDLDLFISVNIPVDGLDEMIAMLEPEVSVVVLNFHEAHSFKENLGKLAQLLGKEEESEAYLKWFDSIVDGIQQTTSSIPVEARPTMFLKTGWGEVGELQTFTDAMPGMAQRSEITGGRNIAADLPSTGGWVQATDPEWLTEQELDVLLIMDFIPTGFGYNVDDNQVIRRHRDQVMALPVFSNSKAVRDCRTFVLSTVFYSTPRFVIGYAYFAKWYHPELFRDLDPRTLHQEYLSRFLDIDLDLSEHGVFVYPEG